jgi:hypothetical protein
MQHCVGSYAKEAQAGRTTIYSLRDPKGHPHVTIEIKNNRIQQIKGKQNDKPAEKYQPYVEEFKEWLSENDISTERVSPHLLAYADALEEHDHDIDEDHLEAYAQEWHDNTSNAEEAVEWLKSGMSAHDSALVGELGSEGVTPEEYNSFPWPVLARITSRGDVPSNLDELVAVARMANKLIELAPLRDGPSESAAQSELFDRPAYVSARVPGQDPSGTRMMKASWGGSETKQRWPSISFGTWDEDYSGDDEHLHWLYPAEEWLAEQFKSDPDDDAYVGPWFIHRFTPELATEWWDAGIEDGELAHELRRRRVTLKMLEEVDIGPALTEFENLKELATRKWLRKPYEGDEAKLAGQQRLAADFKRFAAAIADDIAHQIDGAGTRRNPKRTSRRRV